jgi:hypothetical protein
LSWFFNVRYRSWEQQVFTEQHTQRRTDTSSPACRRPSSLVDHYHRRRKNEDCSVSDGAEHAE